MRRVYVCAHFCCRISVLFRWQITPSESDHRLGMLVNRSASYNDRVLQISMVPMGIIDSGREIFQILPAAGACVFLLLLLGASVPPSPITQVERLVASHRESISFSEAEKASIETIEPNLKPTDKVAIISDDCFELALKLGVTNRIPFQNERFLVLRSQIDMLLNSLRAVDKVIIDPRPKPYPDVAVALGKAGFAHSGSVSFWQHQNFSKRTLEIWTRAH